MLAYLTLAEQLSERRELAGEAFNFSNEIQIMALELVRMILRQTGSAGLEPDVRGEAPHEIPHQYLDAAKARQMLAWRPRFTLEEGLTRTINWYRDFLNQPHKTNDNFILG